MAGLVRSIENENGVVPGNRTLPTALRSHDALSYARRPAAPIPIRPSLFFIVTLRPAQLTAVQDTVQTPRKKTLTYRARLPLLTITITTVVHMVLLCPRQLRR
jgi:hypothetical protein